jgi:hypothetical protein
MMHGRATVPMVVYIVSLLAAIPVSCSNEEGLGGTGSVSGSVIEFFYNDDFSGLIYQQPAVDEEVFILFGDGENTGERVTTGPSGRFRFEYLYGGTYHVYFRSKDSTEIPDDGWGKIIDVEIGNGEDKDLGELVKLNTLDYDDGDAMITGMVKVIKYQKGSTVEVEYVDYAREHEVYLVYGNHVQYDERVRTGYDGRFAFEALIPGDYLVFLYSEDPTGDAEFTVLKRQVTITGLDQVVDLGEITIEDF